MLSRRDIASWLQFRDPSASSYLEQPNWRSSPPYLLIRPTYFPPTVRKAVLSIVDIPFLYAPSPNPVFYPIPPAL